VGLKPRGLKDIIAEGLKVDTSKFNLAKSANSIK
jgi:hypothetical protein